MVDAQFLQAAADAFRRCADAAATADRTYWQRLAERAELEAKAAAHVPGIVFLNPSPNVYLIGEEGRELQRYESDLIGLVAAHTAIANQDRPDLSRTGDFALGDARQADNAIRRAIRHQAADWLDARCRPLATVFRAITVGAGLMTLAPRPGMPAVRTG